MFEQKRFFHARMTASQSLMATDGALKLNYVSVRLLILEFKSMKLNLILLPQLLCAIHKAYGSLHLSKTMAQGTQNASL